jgi:hypothetical protein
MNIAEDIVGILDRVKVMNDGKFHKEVDEYCIKNNLDTKKIHKKISNAFNRYMQSNMSAEYWLRIFLTDK